MDAERWQSIKQILETALETPPEARAAFLDEACGADAELRLEVEKLLEFERTGDDLLEQNAVVAVLQTDEKTDQTGRTIGHYRIVSELGEGGMGAVYLAERADGDFTQKVALKLIKRGMDSSAVVERFLNERRILASLEHPNIARLIDGGAHDGVPFFVMEYADGHGICDYADRGELKLSERLELFREVCAAVSFAHRNLVIHRDLKPSNILVTSDGGVKLLDFGIAKLLDSETESSSTATHVFTPDYASPEQIRGEKLTTATDVYSLGVVLYELLTGTKPHRTDSKSIGEIIKAVCETEPPRPSAWRDAETRSKGDTEMGRRGDTAKSKDVTASARRLVAPSQLRGDLDNIILKALRKEPERRYESVEQFAEDIRRFQTGLPVSASAGTWKYRATKFYQRNRIAVGALFLIGLTLIGGMAATLYQRNKAQRRFDDVRQLANSFLFEFHDAIENLPGSTPARELVVKRAIEYLDTLAAESANDPVLQRELGTAYSKIGEIQGNSYHSNLGDTDGAMKSYRRSLEIRQKLVDNDPKNSELLHELADSYEGVGDILYTINDLRGGLEAYEKAIAIRDEIVTQKPENLNYRYALASVLGKHGDISGMEGFPNLGDMPTAIESYGRAVGLLDEIVKAAPDDKKYRLGYATNLHFYGMLQTTTGDVKGAINNGRKAISILEELNAADPNNSKYQTHLMSALVFLRYPLIEDGLANEAVENARRVVSKMEKMVAEDPKNAFARRSLGVSYNSLGICLVKAGNARKALENHKKSLAIAEKMSAEDPENVEAVRDVSLTIQFLADAQIAAGETNDALANLKQSTEFLEGQMQKGDTGMQTKDDLSVCLVSTGKLLAAQGEGDRAAELFKRALPMADEAIKNAPLSIRVKSRHALSFLEAGKAMIRSDQKTACGYLERSLGIWTEMRDAGTLTKINAGRPEETTKEMAACK